MESLPTEIVDKILEQILWENPRDFYQLRGVSKTWKSIIDWCTLRLSKLWCNKCTNEILEICLDDTIQTRYPKFRSWQDYCSRNNIYSRPEIARDIYKSRNEFPNLFHNEVRFTEICPPPECEDITKMHIYRYAVKDEYLAISYYVRVERPRKPTILVTRIYSINDLNHHIREYPILCEKMDFFSTDKQMFLVFNTCDEPCSFRHDIFLTEFLVNDFLIPSNLPTIDGGHRISYEITDNQCFTYIHYKSNWIQHQRWTSDGFKPDTLIQVPQENNYPHRQIRKIKIYNSTLFVYFCLFGVCSSALGKLIIYQYEITRQSEKNCPFLLRRFIINMIAKALNWTYSYGKDHVYLAKDEWDYCLEKLDLMIKQVFKLSDAIESITAYPHHVLMRCSDTLIVFRGTLSQLMYHVWCQSKPYCLRRFTVIKLNLNQFPRINDYQYDAYCVGIIRNKCTSKFIFLFNWQVYIVDLVL